MGPVKSRDSLGVVAKKIRVSKKPYIERDNILIKIKGVALIAFLQMGVAEEKALDGISGKVYLSLE